MLLQNSPRNELISSLVERLGVPKDSTFIFRTSSMDRAEGDYSKAEITKINKGTVVVVDEKNLLLVLAVQCNEFKEMSTKERERFSMGISTPFLHAKARLTNNLHKSIQLFILAMIWWGLLGCCGWRAGSDPGKKIGPYALKDFLPRKEKEIEADRKRMADFSKVKSYEDQFDTKFKKFAAAKAKREKRMKASTSKGAEKDVPHKRTGKAKNKSSRKSD
ncbi:uncharacterized protein MELLADRAFT_101655 [Melampsora larici-populina 98AG31]|uniref:Uncharacterized protein n=1 Tax=Melampsora larici-populina (strain 98AG31 / pathotype 3-4-7) TaxID=747676 RepID=F4R6J4_MELLP|nr:uncharacterized protein MELLADRAFT_101655 [Melampsora larici-populina 98AG31]EGG11892.1 hypothetical protein MELLADRAFT_101655 [Melampsora larici-populina 98AG31]